MKDRVKLNNGKSSIIKTPTLPATYAEFKANCEAGILYADVSPNDDLVEEIGVSEIGTPLNTSNLLSNESASALGLNASAVPSDAFSEIAKAIETLNVAEFFASSWESNGSGGYTQTVQIAGMQASSKPTPSIYYSNPSNDALCKAELKSASKVRQFTTGGGYVQATASSLPQANFYIQFKGV